MSDKENKKCPRCEKSFFCNSNDIKNCECNKFELDANSKERLSQEFSDCLCSDCLAELTKQNETKPSSEKKIRFIFLLAFLFLVVNAFSQSYPPPAGQPGSTAIYKDSSVFIAWAETCTVNRGWIDISNQSLGKATSGDNTMALGKALANGALSLGDGGSAVCTFGTPIFNGPGFDFAVFENSFDGLFLELAFVEVSSDGQNFFRFPAHSLCDTVNQTGTFDNTDASKIDNLAGKYAAGWGTPFDLQELANQNGLDVHNITHIKIIDVVGALNVQYCSRDANGKKINDPWPTPFAQGGFDLDAIGVIHNSIQTSIQSLSEKKVLSLFPNPVASGENVEVDYEDNNAFVMINDFTGKIVFEGSQKTIKTNLLQPGIYFVTLTDGQQKITQKLVIY